MLRNAVPQDALAIETIRVLAWQAAYSEFLPADFLAKLKPCKNIENLKNKLVTQNTEFSVFVVEQSKNIAAFCILGKPRYKAPPSSIELWALNVHPHYWRQGFGRLLINRAITSSRALGFEAIELWCIKGNQPAEAAYKKAGFTASGRVRTTSNLTGCPINECHFVINLN